MRHSISIWKVSTDENSTSHAEMMKKFTYRRIVVSCSEDPEMSYCDMICAIPTRNSAPANLDQFGNGTQEPSTTYAYPRQECLIKNGI